MIEIDPKDLTRDVVERLRLAIDAEGPTRPLFAVADPGTRPWKLTIGVAIVGVLIGTGVVMSDLGVPTEWRQDASFIPAYGAVLFLVGLPIVLFARAWRLGRGLPFRAGTYVFARDIVISRAGKLYLFPIEDGSWSWRRHPHGPSVTLVTSMGALEFQEGLAHGERDRIAEARTDPARPHDPFGEQRPTTARAKESREAPAPRTARRWWTVLTLGACSLAAPAWFARNAVSDARAWRALQQDPAGVDAYIESGGRHADDAARDVVPRLLLQRELAAHGTSLVVRAWLLRYPGSPWTAEAHAKLDELVATEAAIALAAKRTNAYRQFLFEDADHPTQVASVRAARHAWVESVIGAPVPGRPTRWDELFAYLESHDFPAIRMRMHARPMNRLEKFERDIRALGVKPGYAFVEASPLFDGASRARNEDAWSSVVSANLDAVAPGGMLTLRLESGSNESPTRKPLAEWSASEIDDEIARRGLGPGAYKVGTEAEMASYGSWFPPPLGPDSPVLDVTYEIAPKPEGILLLDHTGYVETVLVTHVELSGFGPSSVAFDATFASNARSFPTGSVTHHETDDAHELFDTVLEEQFRKLAAQLIAELKQ